MTTSMFRTVICTALGLALLVTLAGPTALIGQEKATKKTKGRLPPYYAQVVTEKQRAEIYTIQKKYNDQLDALEAQLKSVQEQRDTEIESLLSADQKEKLNKLRTEALGKRKSKTEAAETTDESEPAAASAGTTTTTTAAPTTTRPAAATTKSSSK